MGKRCKRAALLALLVASAGCVAERSDVIDVADDDPIMVKAIDDARATVDQFIAALKSPKPAQNGLSVKALVEEGETGEHMWLTSLSYADGVFTGTINNAPAALTSIKFGDQFTVPKDEISDWMFIEGGKLVGGYTIRALIELSPDDVPPLPFEID
ncbi:MAG: DUF2314 domain-containing protein [Planctomycetota bacterium]